jgi:hypothetical protein
MLTTINIFAIQEEIRAIRYVHPHYGQIGKVWLMYELVFNYTAIIEFEKP